MGLDYTYAGSASVVWKIISHNNLIKNISPQIWRELEGCVNNHTGWDIR